MKSPPIFLLILYLLGFDAFAQNSVTLIGRMSMRNRATQHYLEVIETRGRWIPIDIGYIDFGRSDYREYFFGGGGVVFKSNNLVIVQEGYLDQTAGTASGSALYFQPFTVVSCGLTDKISGQVVYFTYLPLNKAGRLQYVLETSKLEYNFKHFKAGGGYGAYRYGDEPWQHKPFVTATLKCGRLGDVEFWLQRLPGNHAQAQIRFSKTFE